MSEPQSVSSTDNSINPETKHDRRKIHKTRECNWAAMWLSLVAEGESLCCSAAILVWVFLFFCFNFIASFCWVPQMWVAGVRMETVLLHWLLVSLPFLYWVDSHLKIISCLLHIGWNQWPWQWMEVTVAWSSLFCWLDKGGSFVAQNAHLFPVLQTVRVKQRLKVLQATWTYTFLAASNFSVSHSQK